MCTGKSGHEIFLTGESKYGTKTLQFQVQKGGGKSDDNGGACPVGPFAGMAGDGNWTY